MILNGKFVGSDEAAKLSDVFLLGDGVFETLRTYRNRTFALDRHLNRLAIGVGEIFGDISNLEKVAAGIALLLRQRPLESGKLRIIYGADGNWMATHHPYVMNSAAIRLVVVPSGEELQFSAKSTSYGSRFAARRRVESFGFNDALFCSADGTISEASTSNVLALVDGRWITPNLASGCLPGVTRGFLIEEFGVTEERFAIEDLERAGGVALVSSLREIQPVSEIDGKLFGFSDELVRLQSAFSSWILGKLDP